MRKSLPLLIAIGQAFARQPSRDWLEAVSESPKELAKLKRKYENDIDDLNRIAKRGQKDGTK